MIVLYDNPFSPFARKVRMALRWKDVPYESVDALALAEQRRLHGVNRRVEVPVLVDGDVTVVDSADIIAYLEDRFPAPALLPSSPALRATARRWQRVAVTVLDAIVHDVSLWTWPTHHRSDAPPAGLVDAGLRDLDVVLGELDRARRSAVEKFAPGASPYEAEKVVWRGDRIEWLLAHGFQEWFWSELASGRAIVPKSV